jgi:hypothetical protein
VVVVDAAVGELSKPAGTIEKRVEQIENKYLNQYQDKFKLFFITTVLIMVIMLVVVIFYSAAWNLRMKRRSIRSLIQKANRPPTNNPCLYKMPVPSPILKMSR